MRREENMMGINNDALLAFKTCTGSSTRAQRDE